MRAINFDKGSKRRLRQIRWKQHEIISAILLFLILATLALWFALYQLVHEYHAKPFVFQVERHIGDSRLAVHVVHRR